MHYINDAYYPISIIMKYISMLCVALLLSASTTTQAQPEPQACPVYSTWTGLSNFPGFDSFVPTDFDYCCQVFAPEGKYLYWDGTTPYGNSLPSDPDCIIGFSATGDSSYNDSYGLKGKGSINNPTNVFLDMEVFETLLDPTGEFLQTFNEPEFVFDGGKFRFKSVLISAGTKIRVTSGTELEISNVLKMLQSSELIIEEGATVTLLATESTQAFIDNFGGNITGRIHKEVVFKRKSNLNPTYVGATVQNRFAFNPGLYDVSLHEVIESIQQELAVSYADGSIDKPTVQVGQWVDRDFIEDYPYFANQQFRKVNEIIPTQDIGVISLNSNAYNKVDTTNDFIADAVVPFSAINNYELNYFEGAAILPLYTNTENTHSTFFNDEDMLGYSGNNQYPTTEQMQIDMSRTLQEKPGPFVISISNANSTSNTFKITYDGLYNNTGITTLKNYAVISNLQEVVADPGTNTYLVPVDSVYGIGFDRTPLLDVPLEYQYLFDFGMGVNPLNGYRNVAANGLNVIANPTGNYLQMSRIASRIHTEAPNANLTFYDTRYMIPEMKERDYQQISLPGGMNANYANHSFFWQLPVTNAFLAYNEIGLGPNTDELIDIYNIPGLPFYSSIGDTLLPTDAFAYNLMNPADQLEFHGLGVDLTYAFTGINEYWLNGNGGFGGNWTNPNNTFNHSPVQSPYDQSEIQIAGNVPAYQSWVGGSQPNTEVGPSNVIKDIDYWNDRDAFTLIVLKGITSTDDTIRLAAIPVAFNENFSQDQIERFETSIAPHPGFHLINPALDQVTYYEPNIPIILQPLLEPGDTSITITNNTSNRMLGAFARGHYEDVDSLQIVFNSSFFHPFQGVQSYIIETDIKQTICPETNGSWRFLLGGDTPYGTGYCLEDPDFSLNLTEWNTATNYDLVLDNPASPTSGNVEEFTGEIITFYPVATTGDINNDGLVTTSDLLLVLGNFGSQGGSTYFDGDFNCDGDVTTTDLLIFLVNIGIEVFGPNATGYGSENYSSIVDERVKYLFKERNNDHNTYDFRSYPGFTAQQQTWWINKDLTQFKLYVTDELGWILYDQDLGDYGSGFKLPAKVPDSNQLVNSETGIDTPGYTKGHKIYILFPKYLDFPGFTEPINKLCLGCDEDPNQPTNLLAKPVFTSN